MHQKLVVTFTGHTLSTVGPGVWWGFHRAVTRSGQSRQWELNLGERWSGSLTVCTWYCPSYLSDVPSHTLNESRHTQGSSSVQYLVTLRSTGRFYDRLLWLDFSVSWLDWIFGPGAVEFHSCLLFLCLSTPLLQRSAGGRGRWPAMFLALVVTPELREFLARARGGAVRFIKVRIQDGEWHMTESWSSNVDELALGRTG